MVAEERQVPGPATTAAGTTTETSEQCTRAAAVLKSAT